MKERELGLRAQRAHERMHGRSLMIETQVMPSVGKVRVRDIELGIITYWRITGNPRRAVAFEKQLGERL